MFALPGVTIGGFRRVTFVDVRFTTLEGEAVVAMVESVADDVRRGDAVEVVYDPEDPENVVLAGDEWALGALLAFLAAVGTLAAAYQWWVWRRGRPPAARRKRRSRPPPPPRGTGGTAGAADRRRRRLRRKRRKRRTR